MRVLVVEDDLSVSHWLGSKLHACGHNCRLIDNGEGALRMIRDEAFDVVILDRMLPRMDGIELPFEGPAASQYAEVLRFLVRWLREHEAGWRITAREAHAADPRHAFAFEFVDYARAQPPA